MQKRVGLGVAIKPGCIPSFGLKCIPIQSDLFGIYIGEVQLINIRCIKVSLLSGLNCATSIRNYYGWLAIGIVGA